MNMTSRRTPYRGAIIGFGTIAETTHLAALASQGCKVVAVVETSAHRRDIARSVVPDAKIYDDIETMLTHEQVDFVDICTPPDAHFKSACYAIENGVHVLCEKPLVVLPEHGNELARLAERHDVVVSCVHNWTQAPILKRAAELVAHGSIGTLRHIDFETLRTEPAAAAAGNWRIDPQKAGGGILFDHGWHGMSILLRTVGQTPLSVVGTTYKERYFDLPVEDTCETQVRFAPDVTGRFMGTWAANLRRNEARLIGDFGRIDICDDVLCLARFEHDCQSEKFAESLAVGGYRPAWTAAIVKEFLSELAGEQRRGKALHEALWVLKMLTATYESSLLGGQKVTLLHRDGGGAKAPRRHLSNHASESRLPQARPLHTTDTDAPHLRLPVWQVA